MPPATPTPPATTGTSPTVGATTSVPSSPPERPPGTTDTPTAALIGLVGVVVGALLTQLFAVWREKRQWARQVEHDNQRWEQEREERKEQWAREDESRWHQERLAAYSTLLGATERWMTVAERAKPNALAGKATVARDDLRQLEPLARKIQDAEVNLQLLAPDWVLGRIHGLYFLAATYALEYADLGDRTPEENEFSADEFLEAIFRKKEAIRELIRKDLLIDARKGATTEEGKQ
ncbi:hypothetical protein [Micromonospora chersina]|uniref:hypothetical protein n=1 Tax=Micromonospora chersina TaxID=47854 RepID=UPI001112E842|nr:hypothetical protein [Micromonospora chersina]